MSDLPIPPAQVSGLGVGAGGIGMALSHVIREKILAGENEAIGKREALAKQFEDLTSDPRYNYDPRIVAAAQQNAIRLRTLGVHEKLPKEYQPDPKTGGIPALQGLILHAHNNPPPPPPMPEPPATGPADFDKLFTASGAQPQASGGPAAAPSGGIPGGQKIGPNAISPAPAAAVGGGLPAPPPPTGMGAGPATAAGPSAAGGMPPPPPQVSSPMLPPGMDPSGLDPAGQAVAAARAAGAGATASIQQQIQTIAKAEGIPETEAAARVFSKLYPHEYIPIGRGGLHPVAGGPDIPPLAPTGASGEPKTPAQLGMQGAMGTVAKKYNTTPDKLDANQQMEAFKLYSSTSSEAKKDPEMAEIHKELLRQTQTLNEQKIKDAEEAHADPGERDVKTTVSGMKYADLSGYTGKEKNRLKAYYENNGITALDKAGADAMQDIDTVRMTQRDILVQVGEKLPRNAEGRIVGGLDNKLSAYFQTDAQLAAFGSWRAAAIRTLRALAGSKGLRINKAEIQLSQDNDITQITDTVATAIQRTDNINRMLDRIEQASLLRDRSDGGGGGLPAPPPQAGTGGQPITKTFTSGSSKGKTGISHDGGKTFEVTH